MGKPSFFVKSKIAPYAGRPCDDCGRAMDSVSPDTYWNPNKFAKIRNICAECYHLRQAEKMIRVEQRKQALSEMGLSLGMEKQHIKEILSGGDK